MKHPYVVATEMQPGRNRHISNLGGAEGRALFLGLHCDKLQADTFKYLAAQVKEGITQQLVYFTNILGYLSLHYNSILYYCQLYYKAKV